MGAGRGALTGPLLEAGARVIAVERHPGRAAYGIRGPGVRDMGRRWDLRLGMPVPRRAFTPPPRVDSVVLLARRR
jgi:16S rRNA A1518/A1519 N6-dimethyltransferase RsmA/KsgA/DIM1 with predicted DNA glycosylase/AP lyase activity